MIPTIAILSSAIVGLTFWAVWPLLKADMQNGIDMTVLSVMATAGLLFVGGSTMLAALA